MVKLVLISLVWKYIQAIGLLLIITLTLINKESNDILDQKFYSINNRNTNFSIKPITFDSTPNSIPIGKILYYAYYNKVFDITYFKILYDSKYFWLKNISLSKAIKILFFWYIEVSRLAMLLTLKIIKYNENGLENYLLLTFGNPKDDRIIVRINGKWEINGRNVNFWEKIHPILKNKISENQLEMLRPHFFKIFDKIIEISFCSKEFKATFIDLKTKIPHSVFPESSKDENYYGYQTEYQKAFNKNFYNQLWMIKQYDGPKKSSTLLKIQKDDLTQISKEKKVLILKQIQGAIDNGFNEKEVSKKYKKNINDVKEIQEYLNKLLEDIGINDSETKGHIFREITISSEQYILQMYGENSDNLTTK